VASEPVDSGLSDEDATLVTLARAARMRSVRITDAAPLAGAALRDRMGRTYAAGTVQTSAASLDALMLVVAMAATSGAEGAEAAVVMVDPTWCEDTGDDGVPKAFTTGVRMLTERAGTGVPVLWCAGDGTLIFRSAS